MCLAEAAVVEEQPLQQSSSGWSIYSRETIITPVLQLPKRRISLAAIQVVLEMYRDKLYGIWPMLSAESILHTLKSNPDDVQTYTLSMALSAATLSHLDQSVSPHDSPSEPLTANSFAQEARRVRGTFDYMEPVTIETVLTSYFLHTFYGKQPSRSQTAAFYIREAISLTQLFGMHREETYTRYSSDDQKVMRKLYFLIFMTERYLCIQDGLPTVLEPIMLPTVDGESSPDIISGFLNLVTFFNTPGTEFFSKWSSPACHASSVSSRQLLLLQRELQLPTDIPVETTDVQKLDIFATRHWIRSLAWKLSVQAGYIAPGARKEMNVSYPHQIALDALSEVGHIQPYAFEVHGPGMDVKMTEVATALADSILCLPEAEGDLGRSSFVIRPRDTLKTLCDLIYSTKSFLPELRESLYQKLEIALGYSKMCPSIDIDINVPEEPLRFAQVLGERSPVGSHGVVESRRMEIPPDPCSLVSPLLSSSFDWFQAFHSLSDLSSSVLEVTDEDAEPTFQQTT
jgi:hypothetical protein